MEAPSDDTHKAIAALWANELGGPLMARLLGELHGSKTPLEEEPALFEASKQKFLAAGKTTAEHRIWRQQELKTLRLRHLEHLTWQINQDHPRYKDTGEDELAESWPQLLQPGITLEELDAEVTDWYLQKGMHGISGLPEEKESTALQIDTAARTQPASAYEGSGAIKNIWTRAKPQRTFEKDIKEPPETWRFIDAEDLEGEEMTAEEVRKTIQGKLGFNKASIKDRLEEAQSKASEFSRTNGSRLPVRIHKESEYLLQWFAVTKIGKRGRPPKNGKIDDYTGSLYRLIKGSPFSEEKGPFSDEDQQKESSLTT